MNIVNFTPIPSLIGGILIGVSVCLLLLFNGRIAGISGIAKGIFKTSSGSEKLWRILFIVGLILGGYASHLFGLEIGNSKTLIKLDTKLILGAIFVGIGTSYGNGCTSGHGICGMSRGSKRSILATILFMVSAILTVYLSKGLV